MDLKLVLLGTAPQAHEPRQRSAGHASHLDMVVQVQIHPATAAFSLKNRGQNRAGVIYQKFLLA